MSDPNQGYDVVILGSGSAGYACALRAAQLDLSVAIIEKDKLGGTCLHTGCIPTKALLHAGEVADSTREAAQFGVKAEFSGVDMPASTSTRTASSPSCTKACKACSRRTRQSRSSTETAN